MGSVHQTHLVIISESGSDPVGTPAVWIVKVIEGFVLVQKGA